MGIGLGGDFRSSRLEDLEEGLLSPSWLRLKGFATFFRSKK